MSAIPRDDLTIWWRRPVFGMLFRNSTANGKRLRAANDVKSGQQNFPNFHVGTHANRSSGLYIWYTRAIFIRYLARHFSTYGDRSHFRRAHKHMRSVGDDKCLQSHFWFRIADPMLTMLPMYIICMVSS